MSPITFTHPLHQTVNKNAAIQQRLFYNQQQTVNKNLVNQQRLFYNQDTDAGKVHALFL